MFSYDNPLSSRGQPSKPYSAIRFLSEHTALWCRVLILMTPCLGEILAKEKIRETSFSSLNPKLIYWFCFMSRGWYVQDSKITVKIHFKTKSFLIITQDNNKLTIRHYKHWFPSPLLTKFACLFLLKIPNTEVSIVLGSAGNKRPIHSQSPWMWHSLETK